MDLVSQSGLPAAIEVYAECELLSRYEAMRTAQSGPHRVARATQYSVRKADI